MVASFINACRFFPTLGGTTDWTYSSAVTGYMSPALAGVTNGATYKYRAESADLTQWEIGEGTYNTGIGALARTTVLYNSAGTGTAAGQSGAGSKINFSTVPQVAIVALAEDLTVTFAATQAEQETGSSLIRAVTPGRQQFHLSAAKAWAKFTGSGSNGAQTVNASYNVSGVSRTGTGLYTVSFTTSFSSADYSAVLSGTAAAVLITQLGNGSQAAGSIGLVFSNNAGAQIDPVTGMFAAFGDQ